MNLKSGEYNYPLQYAIAIFHGIGDILNCTPIVHQLKVDHPDCHITWYTSEKYKFVLENNPYIDELIGLPGDPVALDYRIFRLRANREWTRFFTPAPYMNYHAFPGGTLVDIIKVAARLNWTIPFISVFRLTQEEKQEAQDYWGSLPQGKKILIETEFFSQQSPWTDEYVFDMLAALRELEPIFIFTAKNKPPCFDRFVSEYTKAVWCNQPFRFNAEFFNLCDAFVGVSSGISSLTFSDYCRTDVPRIEVARGEHWSSKPLTHHTSRIICYSQKEFQLALQQLQGVLDGRAKSFDAGIPVLQAKKSFPTIIVDGVFFQLYNTGIGRVWKSLLGEWASNGFSNHIVVLDRAVTTPMLPGIRYCTVPLYDYDKTDADREMLQQLCDEEGADLFISSYYTTPLSTPSVFMAYDMIPEVMGWDLNHPMWREKHYAIQHASAYMTISENTARDLARFFPHISLESVTVAPCGVKSTFSPAILEEVNSFKTKYGIAKPYFIMVGTGGYKNTILFFQAFAQLYSRHGFDIVCTGSGSKLKAEFRAYTSGSVVHMLQLTDEELRAAYSGAVALVYPSNYEGFGLPVLEAMACGCPVITCPNASIPEVAGEAALYVNDDDVDGLANALCDVQKPDIRNSLIAAGLEQAKKFSWSKMAKTVSSALINATLLPLNLKDINLIVFPDWSEPEESLCFDLERVVRAIATHPDSSQMTLLVDTGNTPEEEAALILSSVTMNLLLQEDLDVSEGPEISLIGKLGEIQWEALLPRIHARIVLENEEQQAIVQVKAETIPSCKLDSFISQGFSIIQNALTRAKSSSPF